MSTSSTATISTKPELHVGVSVDLTNDSMTELYLKSEIENHKQCI